MKKKIVRTSDFELKKLNIWYAHKKIIKISQQIWWVVVELCIIIFKNTFYGLKVSVNVSSIYALPVRNKKSILTDKHFVEVYDLNSVGFTIVLL